MSGDRTAPFRRAFDAAGYGCDVILKTPDNEAELRECIIKSIGENRRPVKAIGVVGPPERCIITGYDDGGDMLIGCNFFQNEPWANPGVEFEPSGYFRKGDWFKDTEGIVLFGERRGRPRWACLARSALEWALKVMRTPRVDAYGGRRANDLAAFDAWAAALQRDEEFRSGDMPVLRERHGVHDDAVGMVAEARWYGSLFLSQVAHHMPEIAEPLHTAAGCFAAEHDLMWKIWGLGGGNGRSDTQVLKLGDPAVRRDIAGVIAQARARDAEATACFEAALARLGTS